MAIAETLSGLALKVRPSADTVPAFTSTASIGPTELAHTSSALRNVTTDDGIATGNDTGTLALVAVTTDDRITADDGIATGNDTGTLALVAVTTDDGIATGNDTGTLALVAVTTDDRITADDGIATGIYTGTLALVAVTTDDGHRHR